MSVMEAFEATRYTVCDNEFGKLEVEILVGVGPFLHLTLHKWSHNLFKQYKLCLEEVLETIKTSLGYDKAFVIIPDNDEKLLKFEKMFGFVPFRHVEGLIFLTRKI
jgi:hypothetical protein